MSGCMVYSAVHCVEGGSQKFFVVFGIIDKSGIGYNTLLGPGVSMIATTAVYTRYTDRLKTILPYSTCHRIFRFPGDSGGPLIVVDENGIDRQVGIVSYGNARCPSDAPGVFTRISEYKHWINQVVNDFLSDT
ncbi:PREDICTED: transmembrane protease serine 11E-like [Vollenhovia emeryi]|uniref:transmembrane protease serine 11E-like n=1 Tax=Vollenhovia emeryi TaxID=411798 RepID=UPI0005F56CF9|nr:PREDICTED: transmembrane protease serine 11E-like [Vollenhovia emeryi]